MNTIGEALVVLDMAKTEDATIVTSLGKDCTGFVPAIDHDYDIFQERIMGLENEVNIAGNFQAMQGSPRGNNP